MEDDNGNPCYHGDDMDDDVTTLHYICRGICKECGEACEQEITIQSSGEILVEETNGETF